MQPRSRCFSNMSRLISSKLPVSPFPPSPPFTLSLLSSPSFTLEFPLFHPGFPPLSPWSSPSFTLPQALTGAAAQWAQKPASNRARLPHMSPAAVSRSPCIGSSDCRGIHSGNGNIHSLSDSSSEETRGITGGVDGGGGGLGEMAGWRATGEEDICLWSPRAACSFTPSPPT